MKDKKNKKITPAEKKSRFLPDICFLLAIIIIAVFSLYALFYLLIPQSPFIWDESHHAEFAGYVYRTLQQNGPVETLKLINRLILWPPIHSVICGLMFFPFGQTIITARVVSLIFFTLSALLLFVVCRLVYPGPINRKGLIAVILFAASPLVLYFSSACMLETMAIFIELAIFWCYFRGLDAERKRYFILLGLFLGILYLVKYNYALTLLCPLAIDGAIQMVARRKKVRLKFLLNAAIALIVMGVAIGIWFAAGHTREKVDIISYYLDGGTGYKNTQTVFFGNPFFYLRSLATMYTFSIWIFLLYIGGIVSAIWRIKDAKVRVLLLVILVMFFLCTLGHNKQDRYLMLAFPPITILTAAFVVRAYDRFPSRWGRGIFAGLLTAFILIDALDFPGYNRRIANYTVASVRYPAARELTYSVLGIPSLYPSFLKKPDSELNPKADFTAVEHSVQDIWDFIYSTTGGRGALCCLSTFQEFSPHLRRWYSFESGVPIFSRWEPRCAFFASVEIDPTSPFYNKEYRRSFKDKNNNWIRFLHRLEENQSIRAIGFRYYPDINISVRIFAKTFKFKGDINIRGNFYRRMKYTSRSEEQAIAWQEELRTKLFQVLKLEDLISAKDSIPLNSEVLSSHKEKTYVMKEIEINSTPNRRIRFLIALPDGASKDSKPAVICIHGHAANRLSVFDPHSDYKGFARKLAEMGYVILSPRVVTLPLRVDQQKVYGNNRTLIGERLWDLIRCVDYLQSLSRVQNTRIGCAGLSLGGEMAMWLGAMDERIAATVSAGWLTEMNQLEQNHCLCWKFPGLRELVDFSDIYSLIAPQALLCQNGLKEKPEGFNVPLARKAMREIRVIYNDFGQPDQVSLDIHEGGHEINLPVLLKFFQEHLSNK